MPNSPPPRPSCSAPEQELARTREGVLAGAAALARFGAPQIRAGYRTGIDLVPPWGLTERTLTLAIRRAEIPVLLERGSFPEVSQRWWPGGGRRMGGNVLRRASERLEITHLRDGRRPELTITERQLTSG